MSIEDKIKKQRLLINRMSLMVNPHMKDEEFLKRKKEYDDYTAELWEEFNVKGSFVTKEQERHHGR